MSKEHLTELIEPSTLPLNIELTPRHHSNYFKSTLCCIICNTTIDITKKHTCILRHTDIVIHNKNLQYL